MVQQRSRGGGWQYGTQFKNGALHYIDFIQKSKLKTEQEVLQPRIRRKPTTPSFMSSSNGRKRHTPILYSSPRALISSPVFNFVRCEKGLLAGITPGTAVAARIRRGIAHYPILFHHIHTYVCVHTSKSNVNS